MPSPTQPTVVFDLLPALRYVRKWDIYFSIRPVTINILWASINTFDRLSTGHAQSSATLISKTSSRTHSSGKPYGGLRRTSSMYSFRTNRSSRTAGSATSYWLPPKSSSNMSGNRQSTSDYESESLVHSPESMVAPISTVSEGVAVAVFDETYPEAPSRWTIGAWKVQQTWTTVQKRLPSSYMLTIHAKTSLKTISELMCFLTYTEKSESGSHLGSQLAINFARTPRLSLWRQLLCWAFSLLRFPIVIDGQIKHSIVQ